MNLVIGVALLAIAIGMTYVARPREGGEYVIPFMDVWGIGQTYVIAVLFIAVLGVSFCLKAWPT